MIMVCGTATVCSVEYYGLWYCNCRQYSGKVFRSQTTTRLKLM